MKKLLFSLLFLHKAKTQACDITILCVSFQLVNQSDAFHIGHEHYSMGENQTNFLISYRTMTGLPTGHCHLKGHPFILGLVDSPGCDGCEQASETASYVPCD